MISPWREPWEPVPLSAASPGEGRYNTGNDAVAPRRGLLFFVFLFPRLTPWAICYRHSRGYSTLPPLAVSFSGGVALLN